MTDFGKIFIFCLLHFACQTKAQKVESYRFVVKDRVIVDTASKMYANAEFEFSYKRIIKPDSTFEEHGLFEQGTSFITFKKTSQNWYVRNENTWDLFYSSALKVSPSIKLHGNIANLMLVKTTSLYGLACNIYKVSYVGKKVGGDMYYGFNPDKGIVFIQADDVELIRKDILPQK